MRSRFGAYLKHLREQAGLTQLEVAAAVGYEYYMMVSQMERGLARVPPADLHRWADTLRIHASLLAQKMRYWIDPYVYWALYGVNPLVQEQVGH